MARMLPSKISAATESTAEKKVFNWLKDDPRTADWIVLHSLGLARHETLLYGEIDFVVLAPNKGVFCLEVKGGRVARADGLWEFTNRYGVTNKKTRGPFDQAREGMFTLINEIKNAFKTRQAYSNLLFGYGAVFPDIEFDIQSPEFDQEQVWDKTDCYDFGISTFVGILSTYTQKNQVRVYGEERTRVTPTLLQVKEIADYLRGDFDRPVSIKGYLDDTIRQSVRLTNEQFRCLDMFEDNKRLLIEGGAGTGKTLLACELAKRAQEGESIAFFCFNKTLSTWIASQIKGQIAEKSFVGTFHSFMLRQCDLTPQGNDFFNNTLPRAVLALDELPSFDRVIIDEAQDLIEDDYLAIIDRILKNGIDRGRWDLFGDFGLQAIYQQDTTREILFKRLERFASYAQVKLTLNCRNTKNIGAQTRIITGFHGVFPASSSEGLPVTYEVFDNFTEQVKKLSSILQSLSEEGVDERDIAILSPRRFDSSAASRLPLEANIHQEITDAGVSFSTIAAFKGLESPVVIITDCVAYGDRGLLYVGLTRAKAKLFVLESREAQKQRISLIEELLNG